MPVEILEIVVRANVQENNGEAIAANTTASNTPLSASTKEKIIQQCVEQVLAILQHNKER